MSDFPFLGYGCGLRPQHHAVFLDTPPASVGWVEVIAEGFLDWSDGRKLRSVETLEKVRKNLPVVVHGVSLSIGSVDPIDLAHLRRVKDLLQRIDAAWYSDHLCWTSLGGENLHDLLPLPYTEEAITVVAENISRVQDFLGRRILVENVSTYLNYTSSRMPEWEFINAVLERADCGLLLDVNNIYVSARNHGFDAHDFVRAIPSHRIGQIHLAGHTDRGDYIVDTHDEPVCDGVWDLYRWVVEEKGTFSTMIERDDNIPAWEVLEAEVQQARDLGESKTRHAESTRDTARL